MPNSPLVANVKTKAAAIIYATKGTNLEDEKKKKPQMVTPIYIYIKAISSPNANGLANCFWIVSTPVLTMEL